jgi:hypothetical protein
MHIQYVTWYSQSSRIDLHLVRADKISITPPLSMDFVSQKHGVPRDGPKDSNAGG